MGCGPSLRKAPRSIEDTHRGMKAALLIQLWYRRYLARLEAQRRATWSIFQSLEYAAEQEQLRLYNFFNDMMTHLSGSNTPQDLHTSLSSADHAPTDEDEELLKSTNPSDIPVKNYNGPHIKFPITLNHVTSLIDAFKQKRLLHARYVLEILHETRKILRRQPNVSHVSTDSTRDVTVCGDLHGKIDDLFIIFHKNGLPSVDNPYIFNGDFVDRGAHSVEIACILFACKLLQPGSICINRGNHEDHTMNLRYGFVKEVTAKYKDNATKILTLFTDVFSWLPLATVIDQKILVCHGGISLSTDLEYVNTIDRHKFVSALKPPTSNEGKHEKVDVIAWKQVLDILWSDPRPKPGCTHNTFRGGGSYFGPDITKEVLDRHNFKLLIRSHECKPEGYEYDHNRMVLTIFSASNYYEVGSNKGAYVKISQDLSPHIIQYMATKSPTRRLTIKQRVKKNQETALKSLKQKILANRSILVDAFEKVDTNRAGAIPVSVWCNVMKDALHVDIPWRSLRPHIASCRHDSMVDYMSTFEDLSIKVKLNASAQIKNPAHDSTTEALFRNRAVLETIFRGIDTDNSGQLSMKEFSEACRLLGQHTMAPIADEHVEEMVRNMDTNKDGYIDFNEFLNAFKIVDQFGREFEERRGSLESLNLAN